MAILQILLGVSVLTLGRRIFWLFVGVLGFLAGGELAGLLLLALALLGVAVQARLPRRPRSGTAPARGRQD